MAWAVCEASGRVAARAACARSRHASATSSSRCPTCARCATANPPTTAFIELRAREARARGRAEPRRVQRWVPYARISPDLKRAVLVAEDSAFWQHEGIDVEQIRESIETNLEKGTFARGGSTITQQLAKNLYLSPSKNPLRKLRELLIARRLEAELTKRRILEIYLNVIEWGDGIYGAEAAARDVLRQAGGRPRRRRSRRCWPAPSSTRACSTRRRPSQRLVCAPAADPAAHGRSRRRRRADPGGAAGPDARHRSALRRACLLLDLDTRLAASAIVRRP